LARDLTTPLQDQRSDGSRIVFSSGAAADAGEVTAPDLYLFDPRTGRDPARIYENPNRSAALLPIAISGDHFAFAESDLEVYGPGNWVLWYLPQIGADPIVVDRTDEGGERKSPLPLMSLSDDVLVWQAYHQTEDGVRSQLLLFDTNSRERRVLYSDPVDEAQYWYPDLDGDRLVFGKVDYRTPTGQAELHVYLTDIGSEGAEPQQLDSGGRAVTPQINGDTVIWKEAPDVFAWGQIVAYSLTSGTQRYLDFESQSALNYPSLGDRYVAAWPADDTQFWIYDLERDEPVLVEEHSPDSVRGNTRPDVGGNLMVWAGIVGENDIELRWATLPSPGE
jgi:dipeptidyl aminopeptidase/acylaminoacyl peptidase